MSDEEIRKALERIEDAVMKASTSLDQIAQSLATLLNIFDAEAKK